jgi:hypothetical protein
MNQMSTTYYESAQKSFSLEIECGDQIARGLVFALIGEANKTNAQGERKQER